MESVEELCDEITLLHESNKILDGKLVDIKREFKTNTYEIGITTSVDSLERELSEKFKVTPANFKTIGNELKLNVRLGNNESANDFIDLPN